MTSVMQNNPKKRNIFVIDFTKVCCEKMAKELIKGNMEIVVNLETGKGAEGDPKTNPHRFKFHDYFEDGTYSVCPYCNTDPDDEGKMLTLERWNRSKINTDSE